MLLASIGPNPKPNEAEKLRNFIESIRGDFDHLYEIFESQIGPGSASPEKYELNRERFKQMSITVREHIKHQSNLLDNYRLLFKRDELKDPWNELGELLRKLSVYIEKMSPRKFNFTTIADQINKIRIKYKEIISNIDTKIIKR